MNLPLQNQALIDDGDPAFTRVDTFNPAHLLPPGTAAEAINKRFEQGQAWPRYGVVNQAWGNLGALPTTVNWIGTGAALNRAEFKTVLGARYRFVQGNAAGALASGAGGGHVPVAPFFANGVEFTATQTTYYAFGQQGTSVPVTARLERLAPSLAFARFNDPAGFDNLVGVVDEWRDAGGDDGGRGRAWRFVAGQPPQEIPLNGHDVWGQARLVPCHNGLTLLRAGNERHYFTAANGVDYANSRLKLNTTPAWQNGELVLFGAVGIDSFIQGAAAPHNKPPADQVLYHVKNIGAAGNKYLVELYSDAGLTQLVDFNDGSGTGRFYLERRAEQPGYFGNGAPVLLMQPDAAGKTAFECGFEAVPLQVAATAFSAGKVLTAANHRLIPGDEITYVHTSLATETFFANPTSDHTLTLHTSAELALVGAAATAQTPAPAFTAGDYIKKKSAPAQAMPPGREGLYTKNGRLVVVTGINSLSISDPLDPLHHQPLASDITANLGESDPVSGLGEFGEDNILVAKAGSLHALADFSKGPSGWWLSNITREYGIEAALSIQAIGKDVWGLGRKGVVSVRQTEQGKLVGVALPVSRDMQKYLDQVDWTRAGQATAAVWNNRYFVALPLKGGDGLNNGILVHNFVNMPGDSQWAWEGLWQGSELQVYAFAKHKVYGEERLCFMDYSGTVSYFSEDWFDLGVIPIQDKLVTRTYSKGSKQQKKFIRGSVNWDTQKSELYVSAQAPGYQETTQLLIGLEYNPTKYTVVGKSDYAPEDSASRFDEPHRQDYSMTPEESLDGDLNAHQNTSESLPLRLSDWGVALVIENKAGSARINATQVQFVPSLNVATRNT